MNCCECDKPAPRNRKTGPQIIAAGWYVWRAGAPLNLHGLVLCPKHRGLPFVKDAFGEPVSLGQRERWAQQPDKGSGR